MDFEQFRERAYDVALIVPVICTNLWRYFDLPTYYIGEAVSVFLLYTVIFLFAPSPKHWKYMVGIFFSGNRLADELFGDPTIFNWFEYVNALIMVLFFIILYRVRKRKTTS